MVGLGIVKTSDSTDLFSPLPVSYLEFTLMKGLSLQAGKLLTIIGYESAFTYQNNNFRRGLVWNMQPIVNNFSVKLGVNDGFYTLSTTNSKSAFEASLGLNFIPCQQKAVQHGSLCGGT